MAKSASAKLEGVGPILRRITAMAAEAADANVSLAVGYEAPYAVYVHERLDVTHRIGQAKFLEQPAREMAFRLGRLVYDRLRKAKRKKRAVRAALKEAGELLLAASKELVPVDTGFLRDSGFVRLVQKSET